jgi:cytochrome c oxidase accessory protein FixG
MTDPAGRLYVRATKGRFATWRWRLVWLSQALYFALPWLNWNDRQLLRLDVAQQRLYCFGLVLWPQDLPYIALLLCAAMLALFLAGALAERPWCGFACPHTVYGSVFMAVERRIEGSPLARKRLDAARWSGPKLARKLAKHGIFFLLAAAIGWTLVAYVTPARDLAQRAPAGWEWFSMGAYGALAYVNAGHLREQYCRFVCPYARIQGAMQDRGTLLIRYDAQRGEPRARRNRLAQARGGAQGDCVDCTLCVQVCPGGIDIRDGLQFDCIGCAACIDACDQVMAKLGMAPGLIGYAREC